MVTLFVTLDPVGAASAFLILTRGMERAQRLHIARRAALASAIILIIFALGGIAILQLFGITMHAFRIAGGLLLFWTAFEMIYELRQKQRERMSEKATHDTQVHDIAFFPLAIPLIAGPGTISATVLLSQQMHDPVPRLVLIGIIIFCLIITYLVFNIAERLGDYLSPGIRNVLTRLFGLILAALSVQIIADGVRGLIG